MSDTTRRVRWVSCKRWIAAWVILLFSQVSTTNADGTFEHRFGFATEKEPALDFSFGAKESLGKASKFGIAIVHQSKDGVLETVGGKTRFGVRGDGTIWFAFTVDQMTAPDQGWGSGVMLRLEFCDSARSGVTIALQADSDGVLYWQTDHTSGGQDDHDVKKSPAFTDVFEATQVIEVSRTGSELRIQSGAEGRLKLLDERQVSTADIYPIAIWIGTGGGKADLAVELISLRATADQLASDSGQSLPTSIWKILLWCFVGFALVALVLLMRQNWQSNE